MNRTKLEITVGAFVIVGLAAVAYVALRIGAGLLVGTDTYLVTARFREVAGLSAGSKVAISGVTVGSVERVELDPEDYSAVVAMRVRAAVQLPVDTVVTIRSNGLLGDKYVLLRPGTAEERVATGGMLANTEATTDIETAIAQFTGSGAPGIPPGQDSYVVHARFNNASGVVTGSKVAIAGVPVGMVEDVSLNLDDFSALVSMRVRADVQLPLDSIVSVKSSSLIGGKYLAIQLGGDPEMVAPGDTLIETESAIDLESLISRFAFGSVEDKGKDQSKNPPPP